MMLSTWDLDVCTISALRVLPCKQVAALQSEEVNPAFFSALSRVRHIHDNCRALLRTHHQRAGLELMDMMATYQETAYERLCRSAHGLILLLANASSTPACMGPGIQAI